jgi:alanine racemase
LLFDERDHTFMPRPLVAKISIASLQHNLAVARKNAPDARIWAVVKANAYGHTLSCGVRGFEEADGLALVEVDGAVRLRELGWRKPILLLEGFFEKSDLTTVAAHRLQVAVHSVEQIAWIENTQLKAQIDIHLKMNSGMNRLGFPPKDYAAAYHRLRAAPGVRNITLMTHFANADDAVNAGLPLQEQVRRFSEAAAGLDGERSLANSAAVLTHPELAADWIRPGIMLYGGTPGGRTAADFGLQPAMTLTSEIIGVQHVTAGEAVGYGSRFIADKPTTIGVVACGYADGYPRHAPNGTPVLVDGYRTGIIGRVSMDMITVDLSGIPDAHVGSKVTLWGEGLPIDEVANTSGTIGYELMCALAPRVRVEAQ